jgi:hypothetical protein
MSSALTEPVSNVSPYDVSTAVSEPIQGGHTPFHFQFSRSTFESDHSRQLDTVDDDGTLSTVNSDSDASSIGRMIYDDPEFDSLRLNSLVVNRVPDLVISVDDLSAKSWSTEEQDDEDISVTTPSTRSVCPGKQASQ